MHWFANARARAMSSSLALAPSLFPSLLGARSLHPFCVHVHILKLSHAYMCSFSPTSTHTHLFNKHSRTHVRAHTPKHAHTHKCTHMHTHTHTRTHTHTHTRTHIHAVTSTVTSRTRTHTHVLSRCLSFRRSLSDMTRTHMQTSRIHRTVLRNKGVEMIGNHFQKLACFSICRVQ